MAASASAVEKQVKIPANYICSITDQIIIDPVFTDDGHTYEREAIEKWLKEHDTSPKTGKKLDDKRLKPNWAIKGQISEFLQEHPELYEKDEIYLPKSWVSELITAIKANKIKEVQELLTKDKRLLTAKLEGDYTAFHLAAQFGSPELANILLEHLTKRNAFNKMSKPPAGFKPVYLNVLLEESLIKADKPKFSLLLTLGAELNQVEKSTQNTLLHKLVIQGNSEPVKWLLEKGLPLESRNIEGNTPLLLAVLQGNAELTELLSKSKADPQVKNNQKESAISIALFKQRQDLLTLLVGTEKAALPPLHLALALNDLDLLKFLLKQESTKTALEAFDPTDRTPFYYALVTKDPKERKEKREAVKLLLAAGADPTVTCDEDKSLTVLHLAVEQGDLGTLKLLLETKAVTLIDTKSADGNTPLHLAAKAGRDQMISYLLAAGADHEVRNYQGQTPVELAESQSKPRTAALITQKAQVLRRAQIEELWRLQQIVKAQARRINQLEKMIRLDPTESEQGIEDEPEALELSFKQLRLSLMGQKSSSLKFTAKKVQKFLNHVVVGEQNAAEEMLKKTPGLALVTGAVTDHAKRTFKDISGFQYAVWALDWQMWKMIRRYLSESEAAQQAGSFVEGSWVKEYGEHADWKKLLEAQQTLIDNWGKWDWEEVNKYWVQRIGGAQLLLPMHVLQEYNQSDRSFYPCPKFDTEYNLSRGRLSFDVLELGRSCGVIRGTWRMARESRDPKMMVPHRGIDGQTEVAGDVAALASLLGTRTQQRAALVAELASVEEDSASEQGELLADLDLKEAKETSETLISSGLQRLGTKPLNMSRSDRSRSLHQGLNRQFKTTVAQFDSFSSGSSSSGQDSVQSAPFMGWIPASSSSSASSTTFSIGKKKKATVRRRMYRKE